MLSCSLLYTAALAAALRHFLKSREMLAPEVLTTAGFFQSVPYIIAVSVAPDAASNLGNFSSVVYERTFGIVVALETGVCWTIIAGIVTARKFGKTSIFALSQSAQSTRPSLSDTGVAPPLLLGLTLLYLGIAIILLIVYLNAGGVAELWAQIGARSQVLSGSGPEYIVGTAMVMLGMGIVYLQTRCKRRLTALCALSLVSALFGLGVFGARGPAIKLLILLIFLHHYYVRPLKVSFRVIVKFLPLALAVFVFIVAIAAVRRTQIQETRGEAANVTIAESVLEGVAHMSHIETYMVIFDRFDLSNIWLGESYMNLLYLAGLADAGGKIALDDGVYVVALETSGRVAPNELLGNMELNSHPPKMWFGFMQFHLVGLFGFALIVGVVKQMFYRRFLVSGKPLYAFYLMYEVAYNFQPTVYWIVHCSVLAVVYSIMFGAIRLVCGSKRNASSPSRLGLYR